MGVLIIFILIYRICSCLCCVLEFYFSQLRFYGIVQFLLEACILYNLVQLLRQSNTVYFLAYKLFFLIYIGVWFIYLDLDILAFLLWMIYGGFLAVVFILTLMWVDVSRTRSSGEFIRAFT